MIAATAAVASFSGPSSLRGLTARPLTARPLATRATNTTPRRGPSSTAQITADAPAAAVPAADARERARAVRGGATTSLTPCCLAMLPLTIGFIGGLEGGGGGDGRLLHRRRRRAGRRRRRRRGRRAGRRRRPARAGRCLAAGLCALTAFGVASSFGALYGSVGDGALASALPVVLSPSVCGMGLNLLKVLPFELPSLALDNVRARGRRPRRAPFSRVDGARLGPCATPVLVSILGFVAATGDPRSAPGCCSRTRSGTRRPSSPPASLPARRRNSPRCAPPSSG